MRLLCLTSLLVYAVVTAACSTPSAQTIDRPAAATPAADDDDAVRITEASMPFIGIEPVGTARSELTVGAPARVEFKDGALSQVGAPLDGRIVAVHVGIGDRVKAGDPLITLECPDAAEIRSQVESVKASLREAHAALERQDRMLQQGVGIERDRLAAETKVFELEAELSRLEADAAFIGTGRGTAVAIPAPISGTVISRKATVGLAVQKGTEPIIEIGNPAATWIVADVFERDLALVHEGAHATVDLPSLHDPIEGRVASIGAVVTTGLRTAPVRIAIDSHGIDLRPGMYGRVQLQAFNGDLTVPTEAVLIRDGTESVVYVQKAPLTFERRKVKVAQHVGGRVQIVSGLAPGDRIVVKGALLLDNSAEQLL